MPLFADRGKIKNNRTVFNDFSVFFKSSIFVDAIKSAMRRVVSFHRLHADDHGFSVFEIIGTQSERIFRIRK